MEDISDICFNILYSLSFSIADTSFLGPERTGGGGGALVSFQSVLLSEFSCLSFFSNGYCSSYRDDTVTLQVTLNKRQTLIACPSAG